jgi:RHH-type proline utilization regulon transcriptional repressor/proline dehydrogenase/delta 1-pyrroline-5-carboxylate dehydrogenase
VKARLRGLRETGFEFQMLYGLAPEIAAAVTVLGYRVRSYAPVGAILPGMAYLVRRLLENTSNEAWFRRPLIAPAGEAEQRLPAPASVTAQPAFSNAPPARFFDPEVRTCMTQALEHCRSQFGVTYPLLLAGTEQQRSETSEVRYPADPAVVLGRVAQATPEDVSLAVAAGLRVLPAWRNLPVHSRADILRRAASMLDSRRYAFAALMAYECAKPWHEADGDVTEAVDYLRYYAQQAQELQRPQGQLQEPLGERNDYVREARGVTAVIAPWNFPLAILTGMTVAALATGNTVVMKPSGFSPIVAYHLVRLLHEAGVPPEAVQYVPGSGEQVGQALVGHPEVSTIAFTGSNAVGLGIIARAAQLTPGQRLIKTVIAELGGKNAIIIDEDADVDMAVADAVVSAFGYAGQKCSACSRLIIVGSAYETMAGRLREAVQSLVVGPPDRPETFVPPVISAAAQERISRYARLGQSLASVVAMGNVPDGPGYYVAPAVFGDVPLDSPLAVEEIFGPVLSVFRAATFEQALSIANNTPFGLTGGLFSRQPRHIEQARRELRVGNLYINRKVTGAVVGRQAFGGLNLSGAGEKAGGPDYVRQFTVSRTVTENTMRRGFAPPRPVDAV